MTDTDTLEQDQADAVIAGLVGGALSPCPSCGTKTLSTKVYREDREHADEEYHCPECDERWTIFLPEGIVQQGTPNTTVTGMVPFDKFGNQLRWSGGGHRLRPNFIFDDTLIWVHNERSRYSYNFVYRRESTGKLVTTMSTDFKLFLPEMVKGAVTGKFTFRKCGGTAGVAFFKEKKPRAPRGKKKI